MCEETCRKRKTSRPCSNAGIMLEKEIKLKIFFCRWVESDGVTRCISPLPESISRKLRTNTYESVIKPCKPRLFCFYMEQHVERLVQQYKEREQRAVQVLLSFVYLGQLFCYVLVFRVLTVALLVLVLAQFS